MKLFGLVFLLGSSLSVAQYVLPHNELPADTIAVVGNRLINAKDFLERFELMPWKHKEQEARIEVTKENFLYSLIAEKLLSAEAAVQNLATDSVSTTMQYNLERMFVRDELYKREVLPKITVSPQEIRVGMKRFASDADVEVLGLLTEQQGMMLYRRYYRSKHKHAVLRYFRDSLYTPLDTVKVSYGDAEPQFEDALSALGKDSLSKPFESAAYGLVMIRLLRRYDNMKFVKLSGPERAYKVQEIISGRKQDSIAIETFKKFTSMQRAEANPNLFFPLADTLHAILVADSNSYKSGNLYHIPPAVISSLRRKFEAVLADTMVTIENEPPMTFSQVLIGLSDNNIVFPNLRLKYIQWVLNKNIKTVIQNEILSREGFKMHLQQSADVRHDVGTWMDKRRAEVLVQQIMDTISVTDREIDNEYQRDPSEYGATVLVNLQEILVDSLPLAKELREKLNNGEEMATLARTFSKRKSWAANGGISGYVDAATLGDLGMYALHAPTGKLQGPWRITGGLTIFKVLGRKIIDDSVRKNSSSLRNNIRKKLLLKKRQEELDTYIGTLAKRFGVTVNIENLRKLKTTTTNMFTWRNIGFGGRIIAVPPVTPETGWVEEWLRQQHLNQ